MKLSGIEMLGTYPMAGIHETVRYWNARYISYVRYTWNCPVLKCSVHILCQVYMKLSGIEMLGTYPTAGIHETVRYWNVIYMTCSVAGMTGITQDA